MASPGTGLGPDRHPTRGLTSSPSQTGTGRGKQRGCCALPAARTSLGRQDQGQAGGDALPALTWGGMYPPCPSQVGDIATPQALQGGETSTPRPQTNRERNQSQQSPQTKGGTKPIYPQADRHRDPLNLPPTDGHGDPVTLLRQTDTEIPSASQRQTDMGIPSPSSDRQTRGSRQPPTDRLTGGSHHPLQTDRQTLGSRQPSTDRGIQPAVPAHGRWQKEGSSPQADRHTNGPRSPSRGTDGGTQPGPPRMPTDDRETQPDSPDRPARPPAGRGTDAAAPQADGGIRPAPRGRTAPARGPARLTRSRCRRRGAADRQRAAGQTDGQDGGATRARGAGTGAGTGTGTAPGSPRHGPARHGPATGSPRPGGGSALLAVRDLACRPRGPVFHCLKHLTCFSWIRPSPQCPAARRSSFVPAADLAYPGGQPGKRRRARAPSAGSFLSPRPRREAAAPLLPELTGISLTLQSQKSRFYY